VDDGIVHREPGVPLTQHGLAVALTGALAGGAMLVFPRVSPGVRASLSAVAGILALVNGSMHIVGMLGVGITGSDLTGVAAALAGGLLLVHAGAILLIHRRSNPRVGARRWFVRGTAAGVAILALALVVSPLSVAIVQTHKFREPIVARPGARYRDVTFRASDGLRLSGWYSPSRNGAAIVVVNSTRGDRNGSVAHAQLIASHGYGVLLYDARGTGRSEGNPNGYGWNWARDVAGAVSFLDEQPDVRAGRIGALGLSTGADVLLGMGGEDRRIRAIVADGATARALADVPADDPFTKTSFWMLFSAVKLFSGERPGPPLRRLVASIAPTPLLLIATGSIQQELPANETYAKEAHEPVELWELPNVDHTAGIREVAHEYEHRVIGLFNRALLGRSGDQA
jgi:hypothetical protein